MYRADEEWVIESDADLQKRFVRDLTANYWPIYRYVLSLMPQPVVADDLMQEVSLILWQKYETFEVGTSFQAWGRKVALNVCRNYWRVDKRAQVKLLPPETLTRLAETHHGISELLEIRRAILNECLEELPLQKRRLIRSSYLECQSPEKISQQEGMAVSNVYLQISRIRKALVECVNRKIRRANVS